MSALIATAEIALGFIPEDQHAAVIAELATALSSLAVSTETSDDALPSSDDLR